MLGKNIIKVIQTPTICIGVIQKIKKKIVLGIASKVDPQFSQFPQLSHQQCIDNYLQRKYNEKKQRVIEKDRESS